MAGSIIDRTLQIIELLAADSRGMSLTAIANQVGMPKSAAHRLLTELGRRDYARQDAVSGYYQLTTKLLTLSYRHLYSSGLVDMAQPILDRLAHDCGELARLAVIDGERLVWVAKAQGVRSGLKYDPDMGAEVPLYCTATGQAWLSTLDEQQAVEIAARQGFGKLGDAGPNAPHTIQSFLDRLRLARDQGFAFVIDSASVGTSALAAVVRHPIERRAIGTVNITGPSARLTHARILELAGAVQAAAEELSLTSPASGYLLNAARAAQAAR